MQAALAQVLLRNVSWILRCEFTESLHGKHKLRLQDAIELLNTLQTPFKILKERRDAGIRIDKSANEEMRKCLAYIGYSVMHFHTNTA